MDNLLEIYKKLGTTKTSIILGSMVMVLSFLIYFVSVSSTPEMGILYTDLDAGDANRIIDRLKSAQIPMDVKQNGMQILVPREKIAELRMEFAADGLITGGVVGYEMFDKADLLGTSSSLLDINHLRAIEGELSKSIQS
ncbi:MAG: flagellar M-ring protein FliF, partial [Alphaproteobacteria bacterium]|nr:flagellar M-ring protein FliF [Alphaproteobacteria bacterium]